MMAGSASAIAAIAAARSPLEIASSTLRIAVRTRERRALLTAVRRAIWRAAFLADFVLAIRLNVYLLENNLNGLESGALAGLARRL